jgi:peptide/nickel transport system substrate-binding protein
MTGAARRVRVSTTAAVVALLVAACGGGGGGGGAEAATGAVDPDAVLRVAYAGPMQSLDPAKEALGSSQPATFLLYDRLTRLSNDLEVEPMLATSWQFAPDGSYLELTLRDGVSFHDGTPVDATAVKASLERNKGLLDSTVAPALAAIASVEVVDPLTARIILVPGRGAELPTVFTTNAGEIISPKALTDGRDLGLAPGDAGSGPYVVSDFRPGEVTKLERADRPYWDPDAAKFARVEFSYNAQGSTRLTALRAGQVDVAQITGADMDTGRQLAGTGAFAISMAPIITPYTLYIHGNQAPFTDVRIRQAISAAIDRQVISDQLLGGTCEPRVQPYPTGYWPHADAHDAAVAADPARARDLLARAGAGDVRFQLAFTAGSSFEPIAQVIQSQLAPVGIGVELLPLPSATAVTGYRQGQYQAYLGSSPTDADPAQLVQSTYLNGFNAGEAVRDTIVPLADRADDPTLSQQQRGEIYRQIWTEVAEQASVVNICASSQQWAYSPRVDGIEEMAGRGSGYPDFRYVTVAG